MEKVYVHKEELHNMVTPRIVVPELLKFGRIVSVLDVGCGLGTWLRAFQEHGINDCIGIDGDHVDRAKLQIPESLFVVQDLANPITFGRKFDLVLCLEVAEHLPEASADLLVEFLVQNGDRIVFGAAIPGQGGQNHLNEQWPLYWQNKFSKYGYYFHDALRPKFWNNPDVFFWYSQNLFLVTKEVNQGVVLSLVHPELFSRLNKEYNNLISGRAGVVNALKIFIQSIKAFLKRSFFESHKQ